MAILKDNVIGTFSGKVGGIVGYELNGQTIIRGLPSYTKRKPSPLAALNQQRMKAVSQFLKPIKRLIEWGYRDLTPPGSRVGTFQLAQSYIFKHSLDYDSGNDNMPYVNPEKVLLFRGDEPAPENIHVKREGNTLIFEWQPGYHRDMLVAAIYDGAGLYDLLSVGPGLKTGRYVWEPHHTIMNQDRIFHVYVGAKNTLNDKLSDSVYLGVV